MGEILLPSDSDSLVSKIDEYSNPDTLAIGSVVYFEGSSVIREAANGGIATAPARGVIIAQTAVAVATVLYSGPASVFAGLSPGAEYFLGPAGDVVQSAGLPSLAGTVVQRLGRALDSTTLLFFPSQPVVL